MVSAVIGLVGVLILVTWQMYRDLNKKIDKKFDDLTALVTAAKKELSDEIGSLKEQVIRHDEQMKGTGTVQPMLRVRSGDELAAAFEKLLRSDEAADLLADEHKGLGGAFIWHPLIEGNPVQITADEIQRQPDDE